MYRIVFTLVLFLLLSACETLELRVCPPPPDNPTTTVISPEKAVQISEIVCTSLNANELIGLQLSIRDSTNQVWNASFGSIDVKQTREMENHHILRVGSVTKMFTATLILQLIEEGVLELDQSITDFYPDQQNIRAVTIRQLLNHSSGIVDIFSIPSTFISASNFADKQWNPHRLVEVCMEKKLAFTPGTRNDYSNTNYIILGLIAEDATGKKIGQLFTEYITDPYRLPHTYLVPYMNTPPELITGYVHHFALSLTEWYKVTPNNTAWSTLAYTAGAMTSNAADLSAFAYQLFRGDIITSESLELMTTFSGDKGLGLFEIAVNDEIYWGHEGEITGFEAINAYHPETKMVISICCNTTPFDIFSLLNEIDAVL